ncbi:MAG: hypothetical protein LC772_09635, partial [Chloroflexi bacterium]|nr:hypothetical protein [Chloroflexota bacterium]
MSSFNRFLALVLLLIAAAASLVVLLALTNLMHVSGLHFGGETQWPYSAPSALNLVITDPVLAVGRYRWAWVLWSLAAFVLSVLLIVLELRGARPPRGIVLHQGESGSTLLYMSALVDLARWTAEDTAEVE